jgi:hypothetical protein
MSGAAEFSVWWWDGDGGQHEELRFVRAQEAVDRAHSLTSGPAALIGMITRVMITDGGDNAVFLWKDGAIQFPKEEDLKEAGLRK